jgi:hypothetical protein
LLEEAIIDNTQAHLIYEIFHDRILEREQEKKPLIDDHYIIGGLLPITAYIFLFFFFVMIAVIQVQC